MRVTARGVRGTIAAVLSLAAVPAGAAPASPRGGRAAELLHLLQHECGSCHGLTLKGGLGPPLRPAALAGKADEALVDVILNGVPGSPMAPWGLDLSAEEAAWLVRRLKRGLVDAR
jgi:cytochrome c55X